MTTPAHTLVRAYTDGSRVLTVWGPDDDTDPLLVVAL